MFTLNVVFLCLTVTVVFCEFEHQNSNKYGSSPLESCKLEANLSQADFEKMVLGGNKNHNATIPIAQAEKCFVDCLMRKTNMINNGKISAEVMTKFAVHFYGRSYWNEKLIYKRIENLITACVKKVSDQSMTEECAVAAAVYTCMLEETQKTGLADQYGRPAVPTQNKPSEIII